MAGPVSTARDIGQTPARTSSIDSAISAISSKSLAQKGLEGQTSEADIAHLVKTAGSPEAVIQYLLKEKNSQAQQNSQLWRLVDKQRAMILGLNKDLEKALKDKEKYRKKLKDIMALPGLSKVLANGGAASPVQPGSSDPRIRLPNGNDAVRAQSLDATAPDSPNMDSDSQKHSPTDMSMAPYPITPPADQPNAPPSSSAVGEILDPARAMPKPEEHAHDRYNHEAMERAADDARKDAQNSQLKDLPINLSLPPSRSIPSEPPSVPPPRPPPAPPSTSTAQPSKGEEGLNQFPAPPPRKGPPAPLHINKGKNAGSSSPEDEDTDTDYDDILEVDSVGDDSKRGRRKTREEDEYKREMAAQKEAERRSLSNKNRPYQNSQPTPSDRDRGKDSATIPISPRQIPPPLAIRSGEGPTSLEGVMKDLGGAPSLPGQGLPASPRPFGNGSMGGLMRQPMGSPPLSPRGMPGSNGAPLSPRPPRQAIPLPPNTPLATSPQSSNASAPPGLNSPRPLNIPRPGPGASEPASPMNQSRDSPTERTTIFKGFVTDEYPGLLLPPNALPSIEVRVASSRMKPSRASLLSLTQLEEDPVFTLAVHSRADGGELWRIEKDSASLAKLDNRMKRCPAFNAKTPDRALFSGHSPAKLDARRIALDQYMDELLNTQLDTDTAVELCRYFSTNSIPPNFGEASYAKPETEAGNHRKDSGGRSQISGYLTKRGKNFGGWKARYFALDGPLLKYYEGPGGAHLGTIKLQNAQIGKQAHNPDNQPNNSDEDNQYRHAFLVLEPKKKDSSSHVKHVLCAESDRERDQWVDTLLQWIDYRDPEDESVGKRGAQDRQGASDRQRGQGKKKRDQAKSQHDQSNSDALIGVSYDSTTAGDAPQAGTQRPKGNATPSDRPRTGGSERPRTGVGLPGNPHDTEFQVPAISAPRDPQVISDSSSWGAKMGGLMPPTVEEKKQRKRSFFGFGPKARSSSDGQESLFDNASNSAQNEHRGPVRQVFGAPVAEAVRFNAPVDINVPLPAVVYRCIQYLDHRDAISEEGIFRLSGSNVVIKQLRERFNTESDVDLVNDPTYYDIHAVASLLKLYLRELPTTILTRDLHLEFLAVTELSNMREKVAVLGELVQRLPQANATLLMYLIAFLIKIINNSDKNKMTVRNVGIVFSPTLNIPAPVFAMFLQNYEPIFGIEPEEYELPSPSPDSDTQSQMSGREPGPRPSTAQGTSVSPHRQRLMQSVADPSRGASTSPLLHSLNEARGSSTPPPSFPRSRQGSGYEPQYMGQQPQRPAYEGGYNVPQGYDPSGFYAPPRSANPGYDRPLYASDGSGSGSGSANFDKRRESAILGMGGPNLTPQQSKSRLREETLF